MSAFRISVSLLVFAIATGFPQVLGNAAKAESAATQPLSADTIATARQAMLQAADEHVASLRALLSQLPADQQPQSQTNQRLQDALAQRAKIVSATDGEITAQLNTVHTASATRPAPSIAGAPAGRRGIATTKPMVNILEAQLVFPGAATQGQIVAQVRPPSGCELLTLHAPDGTAIVALFGKGVSSGQSGAKPALLYFYGNGMCMAASLDVFGHLRGLGFDVIMADYEGYGMSDGTPSESGCYAAADAAYDYLLGRNDVDQARIVAAGWSLGAAVALDLASRRRVAGVATFSAFTSMSDMGQTIAKGLPVALLFSSRFDNLAKISTISCPIFMAHGTSDPLVPPEMLERLSKSAKSKVTVVHVAGAQHNDIFLRGGDSLYNRLKVFVNGLVPISPTTAP